MMKRIFMFIMAMMMFTVNVCAETESSETEKVKVVYSRVLDCGVHIFETSEGKWGAYGDNFRLEPVYYLPCDVNCYYDFGDTFVLALKDSDILMQNFCSDNTYYVFNSGGELIKTLTYGVSDIETESPGGYEFEYATVYCAYGSNLLIAGTTKTKCNPYSLVPCYIKRLYSEKVVDGYYSIYHYEDEGFQAIESTTWRWCTLNVDGSFKEYLLEDDGSYKTFNGYY